MDSGLINQLLAATLRIVLGFWTFLTKRSKYKPEFRKHSHLPIILTKDMKLSKPNVTQLNSKQLESNFVEVRHSSHLEPTLHHPTLNFSGTSRPARELKLWYTHSLD